MKEELFKLEAPDISGYSKQPIWITGGEKFRAERDAFLSEMKQLLEHKYFHWIDIKNSESISKPRELFWARVKFDRRSKFSKTPIKDTSGNHFKLQHLSWYDKLLHDITHDTSGNALFGTVRGRTLDTERYMLSSLIEEAIASSQLEGASTTRKRAKEMILKKLSPRDKAEKMIMNNYQAIMKIESEWRNSPLSLEMLLEMHRLLTEGTLLGSEEEGRLRNPEDDIVIAPKASDQEFIIYKAPPVDFVKTELERLIAFANDDDKVDGWRHPVIKAIMLHFWLAYLHPFTDGNGRLARCLFYWYLLRHEYYAFAFLPITTVIKKAPKKYWMAFVCAEQDENDLTYFVDYHLRIIQKAQGEFVDYVKRKSNEIKKPKVAAVKSYALKDRQIDVLRYFYNKPNESTDAQTHTQVFAVTLVTAFSDLKDLEKKGFLTSKRIGKRVHYFPTEKVKEVF